MTERRWRSTRRAPRIPAPPPAVAGILLAGVLIGCGGPPAPGAGGVTAARAQESTPPVDTAAADSLVPAGFGTLSQDAITIPLRADGLLIKVTPLAEGVIRLTAPDTYRRLSGYTRSRADQIRQAAANAGVTEWPHVFLVQLFTREVQATFEPHDLQIINQNQVYRPLDILPITPGFGRNRLDQQQTELAMYLFDPDIDLDLPMTVRYQTSQSGAWSSIRHRLDRERSLVLSRAAAAAGDTSP